MSEENDKYNEIYNYLNKYDIDYVLKALFKYGYEKDITNATRKSESNHTNYIKVYDDYEELGEELEDPILSDEDPIHRSVHSGDIWKDSEIDEWSNLTFDNFKHFVSRLKYTPKRPLVLVPGYLASKLTNYDLVIDPVTGTLIYENGKLKKDEGDQLWPPFYRDPKTGAQQRRYLQDLKVGLKRPTPGKDGLVDGYYENLLKNLKHLGYELDKTLFIFNYNWTETNRKSGKRLAGYINKLIEKFNWSQNNEKTVDVINHSNGGIVTRAAAIFYKAPINRTIYVASPFYGTPRAFFTLHPEIEVRVHNNWVLNFGANVIWNHYKQDYEGNLSDEIKKTAVGLPSLFELLPDSFYFRSGKYIGEEMLRGNSSDFDPVIGLKNTYFDHPLFSFKDQSTRQLVEDAMKFKNKLGKKIPGKLNLILYSKDELTHDIVKFWRTGGVGFPHFGTPEDSGDRGDGTAPTTSAKGNAGDDAIQSIGEHNEIQNNDTTYFWIAKFLTTTD